MDTNNNLTINSVAEKISNSLQLPINPGNIQILRDNINLLSNLLKVITLPPNQINKIVLLMQRVFDMGETFMRSGIRNVEGGAQLRHDLYLVLALIPEIIDVESTDLVSLDPNFDLYDWLLKFKESDEFDRGANHPLSLSHIVIRSLILFGLDSNGYYNTENIFRTIAVAVFKREIHYSYFPYAARYVNLKHGLLE